MDQDRTKRKLTAILSADVVGYSRLMEEDEAFTIQSLEENKRLISGLVKEYGGRVVDAPGDNILAEFKSVINAVECAIKIQQELKKKNDNLIEARRMHFRIGVNLGDIVEEDGRIYGNGVNIAARLEGLAEPGGICISSTAFDQVNTKLDIGYEFLGEHNVKNITVPVGAYRLLIGGETVGKVIGEKKVSGWTSRKISIVAIIVLIIIAAGLLFWDIYSQQARKIEPASIEPEQVPEVGEVKEAPKTIAVLPFEDISPESDQQYFVDGLSEEILNSLAQIPDLLVTGRTSSFSFKDSNKTAQDIAEILGVENILEGSVRKAGNILRITAQLLRAKDGFHLWSKSYDRELKDVADILSIQEDIATSVANELKLTLGIGQSLRQLGGTDNVEAYEHYLVAIGQIHNAADMTGFMRAFQSIEAAIASDPEFALAWALKAQIQNARSVNVPANSVALELDEALNASVRAIELEPNLAQAYISLGVTRTYRGYWIEAELAYRKAFESTTETSVGYLIPLHYLAVGNSKRAYEIIEAQLQEDPLNPMTRAIFLWSIALLGDVRRAEAEYERGSKLFVGQWSFGDGFITQTRLGFGDSVSRNEIVSSDSTILDVAKEHIESPKEALAALHNIYTRDDTLSTRDLMYVSLWAAYFGDPEFAMDSMEKALSIERSGIFQAWFPVMHEVRQLPRFKKFVREISLVDYWNKFGWPDICHKLDNGDFVCD